MSDEDILARGGTEEDIAMYAHDVGKACMYPDYPCEICEAREKAEKLSAWKRLKDKGFRFNGVEVFSEGLLEIDGVLPALKGVDSAERLRIIDDLHLLFGEEEK